jgi:predicted 2-oxoglutarate/Fe(II)-dependent dioxygenase YbiX
LRDGTVVKRITEQLRELERENAQLRQQLHSSDNVLKPDYDAIGARVLGKLKVGKQSTAGKAIDAFIKELQHQDKPKPSTTTAASLVTEAYKRYEQGNFVHTDVYENALFGIASKCGLKMFRDIKGKNFYITPQDNWGEKLVTSSSIGGMAEFLSTQPLLKPQ